MLRAEGLEKVIVASWFTLVSDLANIPAALVALLLVRRVIDLQERAQMRLRIEAGSQPSGESRGRTELRVGDTQPRPPPLAAPPRGCHGSAPLLRGEVGPAENERETGTLELRSEGSALALSFVGRWLLAGRVPHFEQLRERLPAAGGRVRIGTERLEAWDSALLTFLLALVRECDRRGVVVEEAGLPAGARRLLRLARAVPVAQGGAGGRAREGLLARVGGMALSACVSLRRGTEFVGEIALALPRLVRGKARIRRQDLWALVQAAGADALPIVSLINVLVGLILAFVGSVQLALFGAEIYVASLVGIAMVRVMAPIMTGILLAGRTGAAYAAQLGTMQVNEEVDALETMGIRPVEYLILPRLLALGLMTPLLCLYADLMGILGGLIVGTLLLGISVQQYVVQTVDAVGIGQLWIGILHGFVFGCIVALSGCYHGIRCGRSAAAVGVAVTSAVVSAIVGIVVATAILTVVFDTLGI